MRILRYLEALKLAVLEEDDVAANKCGLFLVQHLCLKQTNVNLIYNIVIIKNRFI